MKAVVFHDVGDIRLDDVPDPKIQGADDAIIKITHNAICGTDLHMIRGTMAGMKPGTIMGHEAVGIVEECGRNVRNLDRGDRVVVPSTIACGYCSYCRAGYYSQCDVANPNGKLAGTVFFGGPESTGPFDGLQAEYARIPFANVGLVKLPDEVSDDAALMVSDIVPTGYFGAHMADIQPGKTVAVFGCGPVGMFAIVSSQLMGASRVLAVDHHASRLDKARSLGAEVINFDAEDPVETVRELTGGIGVDRVIDAVGVDAEPPREGPAAAKTAQQGEQFRRETETVAPTTHPQGDVWKPGGAPSLALEWSVKAAAKAGVVSVIGVYPPSQLSAPIGLAMQHNLTVRLGNCNHRRYVPALVDLLRNGTLQPQHVISQQEPLTNVIDAYRKFDQRETGWMKVELGTAA